MQGYAAVGGGACSYFLRDRYAPEFQSCTKDECGSQYKNSPRKHSRCKWHGNNSNIRYVRLFRNLSYSLYKIYASNI